MKNNIISLTEKDIHYIVENAVRSYLYNHRINAIVNESIYKVLNEDGEIGGGGAANCVDINVGGAAGQAKNQIDVPAFGGKPLKQKHNLGKKTTDKANTVDMTPALDRTPGFSVGERIGRKKSK